MRRPSRRRTRPVPGTGRHPDPSVQVVHDAIAFATAAIDGDGAQLQAIATDAMATDEDGFLAALATTVAVIAEEANDRGADIRLALREIGLGVHLAAMAETSDRAHRPDPDHHDHHDRPEG